MPFEEISYSEFVAQANAELRRVNPDLDPTVAGSFAKAFMDSSAALGYSVQQEVLDLVVQLFPQTAEGEFLDRWAGYEDLERLPASNAEGSMSIGGFIGTTIPAASVFTGTNGLLYESQSLATVVAINQNIASLDRLGTTVTATLTDDHTLATGIPVIITGAVEPEYNGNFECTVIARNQFTYEITTAPTTPATGTILYEATYASVLLQSVDTGLTANTPNGSIFTATPEIAQVDTTGAAQIDGMSGGSDEETDAALRTRVILSRSINEGVFTSDQVKLAALSIAGNTRAFVITPSLVTSQTAVPVLADVTSINRSGAIATVITDAPQEIGDGQPVVMAGANQGAYNGTFLVTVIDLSTFTYEVVGTPTTPATGTITVNYSNSQGGFAGMTPTPGQVVIYILRDNDANIIPTQTVLDNTKAAIIADGALPAHSSEDDVFVLAPTIVEQDFVFSSLNPNTPTMQTAVVQQLEAFFEDTIDFEETVTEASYLGAIQNTQDLETGDLMSTFSLTTPTGDIVAPAGSIVVLGDVTFPV